jgi:hypothetical protein
LKRDFKHWENLMAKRRSRPNPPTPPTTPKDDFAAVSLYVRSLNDYFKKLLAYIQAMVPTPVDLAPIVDELHTLEANAVKIGDQIRLYKTNKGEWICWMTAGGEIKSRAANLPEFTNWQVQAAGRRRKSKRKTR